MRCLFACSVLCLFALTSSAQEQEKPDLTEVGLEQLINMEVTSVSKKKQSVAEAAVAIFVITQKDIQRSGATSIPELLRMAPGLNVAQIDANKWAISSRGFNSRFSNKLLVMIDGRTVYTPLFSGVFWDVQDTLLEDIERIEVIRGPGATLWGANAVNGVINIITKRPRETRGGMFTGGLGSEEKGFAGFRYGDEIDSLSYYRVYGKYFNRDNFVLTPGVPANDSWDMFRAGFRAEKSWIRGDSVTVQGDLYNGDIGDQETVPSLAPPFLVTLIDDAEVSGGNLLGRWERKFAHDSDMALRIYYDRTNRLDTVHRENRDTFDMDFQHRFAWGSRQEIVWGLGYRYTNDDISGIVVFDPSSRADHLFSGFIQDEIRFYNEEFRLTVGTKFENNDYTGTEIQPNVRMLWTPEEQHTIWGAISRAVRTPSRFEHNAVINVSAMPVQGGLLALTVLLGDPDFESEDLVAYELGYRAQPDPKFHVDVALFYNDYRNLRTFETGNPFFVPDIPPHLVVPLTPENRMDGHTYGLEVASTWMVTDRWKLAAGYSHLQVQLNREANSTDTASENAEGDTPKNQFQLRSFIDLPADLKWDATLYFVDSLFNQEVSSYWRADMRLGWYPGHNVEVSFTVQNLFHQEHPEFGTSFLISRSEIERNVYGKLVIRF
ncbi:TonB-dependent receptor [bacterium]|nr:TonB-dependent receptor [bacterium]MCI0603059.1 TonB-dependent receptor [bacterium]